MNNTIASSQQPAASSQQPAASSQQPAASSRFARSVAVLVGGLLLIAASLKLYGMSVSPLPSVGWMSLPVVQLAVVAWELILGIWLISNFVRPLSWLVALFTFSVFAGVSAYYGIIGQASCGCFGTIQASPWAAFGVDVIAVTLLVLTRPTMQIAEFRTPVFTAAKLLGGTAALIGLLALGSTLAYGSVSAAIVKMRGDSLSAPSYVDFGSAKPGERLEQLAIIHNWTDAPICLIGGTSDCSCVTTSAMPLTVPPGESISVTITLKVPSSNAGAFTRTAAIWTDCSQHQTIKLRLGCQVE